MYCVAATVAYRRPGINPETGKHYAPWSFSRYKSDEDLFRLFNNPPSGSESVLLPCGKCLLCTRRHRFHWVLRCLHEMHFHLESCYLTLTVDDAHIDHVFPPLGRAWHTGITWNSLRHKPFQDFMKRLRITLDRSGFVGDLRFFMCGEYGDQSHRPHYHAIIFGWFPRDAFPLPNHRGLFVSPLLSRLWKFGFHTVGRVEPQCISYVSGYVDKKLDAARMQWADNNVAPEYVRMSRNPGIGRDFCEQFLDSDIFPMNADGTFARDFCLVGKTHVKTPRYYDNILQLRNPEKFGKLLAFREQVAVARGADFDLGEWLNVSHRKHAVAAARRRQRDPGVVA